MLKGKSGMLMALILILCSVTVVCAAEADYKIKNSEPVMAGTSRQTEDADNQQEYIRMANEDAIEVASMTNGRNILLNEREFSILARIVEAEATDKDAKSKILVANVVLNRMKHEEFPDTVEEVVFQKVAGTVQFSPILDGRYYKVDVTEETKECVRRALSGEDYSQGALYFMERSTADADNVSWFDRALTHLFEHEGHEFYR